MSPTSDVLDGTPYRPVRCLRRGGMGEVWEAEHKKLGKPVVVKLLHAELADDPGFVDRMRLEAQAIARVGAPHVVEVHDMGLTRDHRPYYVMERLQGRTLDHELEARGPLPPREAIEITLGLLRALAAVHQAGLVHRDVKLDNVFYSDALGHAEPRLVRLLDFGVVKLVAHDQGMPPPLVPTEAGVTRGTPRYSAPELILGEAVDARSDLYAAGLVLYALLAGRGPFDHARSPLELLKAQIGKEPRPPLDLRARAAAARARHRGAARAREAARRAFPPTPPPSRAR
jgi:serine/threonine protein kinase